MWCHIGCGYVKPSEYKHYQQMDCFDWICPRCLLSCQPFAETTFLADEKDSTSSSMRSDDRSTDDLFPESINSRNSDSRELLIMHLNINGLQNKFEEVKQLVQNFEAQVLFLTETKIDNSYPKSQFRIDGYEVYCRARVKGGGGVMALFSSGIPSKKVVLPKKLVAGVETCSSGGSGTSGAGLVGAWTMICPSKSGSVSTLLFRGASRMWALLCLSSLPVAVVMAYDRGTPGSFALTSAGFHFSVAGS